MNMTFSLNLTTFVLCLNTTNLYALYWYTEQKHVRSHLICCCHLKRHQLPCYSVMNSEEHLMCCWKRDRELVYLIQLQHKAQFLAIPCIDWHIIEESCFCLATFSSHLSRQVHLPMGEEPNLNSHYWLMDLWPHFKMFEHLGGYVLIWDHPHLNF